MHVTDCMSNFYPTLGGLGRALIWEKSWNWSFYSGASDGTDRFHKVIILAYSFWYLEEEIANLFIWFCWVHTFRLLYILVN